MNEIDDSMLSTDSDEPSFPVPSRKDSGWFLFGGGIVDAGGELAARVARHTDPMKLATLGGVDAARGSLGKLEKWKIHHRCRCSPAGSAR